MTPWKANPFHKLGRLDWSPPQKNKKTSATFEIVRPMQQGSQRRSRNDQVSWRWATRGLEIFSQGFRRRETSRGRDMVELRACPSTFWGHDEAPVQMCRSSGGSPVCLRLNERLRKQRWACIFDEMQNNRNNSILVSSLCVSVNERKSKGPKRIGGI